MLHDKALDSQCCMSLPTSHTNACFFVLPLASGIVGMNGRRTSFLEERKSKLICALLQPRLLHCLPILYCSFSSDEDRDSKQNLAELRANSMANSGRLPSAASIGSMKSLGSGKLSKKEQKKVGVQSCCCACSANITVHCSCLCLAHLACSVRCLSVHLLAHIETLSLIKLAGPMHCLSAPAVLHLNLVLASYVVDDPQVVEWVVKSA